jgi:hypothetical protein
LKPLEFIKPESITLDDVQLLAKYQSIDIVVEDREKVLMYFKLVASHAQKFMSVELDEVIEPAPTFKP